MKNGRGWRVILLCGAACLAGNVTPAVADVVVLQDGKQLKGKLINANQVNVSIILNGQETVLPRSTITRIEFEAPKEGGSTAAQPEFFRTIANKQDVKLRISAWTPPSAERPGAYGVFYQLLSELKLSEKDKIPAGATLYGTVTLQKASNGSLQFVKTLDGAYEPRRRLKLMHGAVSPLRASNVNTKLEESVVFSPGGVPPQQDSQRSQAVSVFPWLKVGNVVEWSFLAT